MPDEKLCQAVGVIREILTILVILIGGAWTVVEFNLLETKAIAELGKQKLERELEEYHPVMQLELDLTSWHSTTQGYLLEAAVKVTNIGKLGDRLDLTGKPFHVYPVIFHQPIKPEDAAASPVNVPVLSNPWGEFNLDFPQDHHGTHLLPGESQTFRILQQLPKPGIYYVQFVVPLSETGREHWPEGKKVGDFVWSTGKFIEVQVKPNNL